MLVLNAQNLIESLICKHNTVVPYHCNPFRKCFQQFKPNPNVIFLLLLSQKCLLGSKFNFVCNYSIDEDCVAATYDHVIGALVNRVKASLLEKNYQTWEKNNSGDDPLLIEYNQDEEGCCQSNYYPI
jgi:hypothetical protein